MHTGIAVLYLLTRQTDHLIRSRSQRHRTPVAVSAFVSRSLARHLQQNRIAVEKLVEDAGPEILQVVGKDRTDVSYEPAVSTPNHRATKPHPVNPRVAQSAHTSNYDAADTQPGPAAAAGSTLASGARGGG